MADNSNWVVKSVKYHDKKRNKLWMTVGLENLNSPLQEGETCHDELLHSYVEFINGKYSAILNTRHYNQNKSTEGAKLTEELKTLVIDSAIAGAQKYLVK